jgi:uncharacterized membrane protein
VIEDDPRGYSLFMAIPTPTAGRLVLALLFLGAGAMHFIATPMYVKIMPSYVPNPLLLVYISGFAEMLGGAGLLFPQVQRAAAWGLIALLIAVFPANVTMVTDHARFPQVPLWAAWVRLPLQVPMIWWAWLYTRRR